MGREDILSRLRYDKEVDVSIPCSFYGQICPVTDSVCEKEMPIWPFARYVKLRAVHAPGMPRTFSLLPRVGDPDLHHGTCRVVYRDRWLNVFFEVGGGEKVPSIPAACATHNSAYLVRAPCRWCEPNDRTYCFYVDCDNKTRQTSFKPESQSQYYVDYVSPMNYYIQL